MKLLILLVVVAAAGAQTFVPQDTPEVAAAKAAHLVELAKAGLAAGVPYYPRGVVSIGVPVVTADGYIADTPEVAAAKAAHFALKEAAAAAATAARATADAPAFVYSYPVYRYAAPRGSYYAPPPPPPAAPAPAPAHIVVTPDGFVADTPEVFAAKVAHFHAHIDRVLGIS